MESEIATSTNIVTWPVTQLSRFFKVSSLLAAASFFTSIFVWLILFLLLMFITANSFGQSPNGFSYQAVVRNSYGSIMPNQTVSLRFSIRGDSINGPAYFQETDTVLANQQGVFTVVIGGGNIVNGHIGNLPWGEKSFYLQVEMDVYGGINYQNMGTSQLLSAPYAFYANRAGSLALNQSATVTVTGNDSINVEATAYVAINSGVSPSNAITILSNGSYAGQILVLEGRSSTSYGVRFENYGNINVGVSTGYHDLFGGSILTLIWNGSKWTKIAYSSNQ